MFFLILTPSVDGVWFDLFQFVVVYLTLVSWIYKLLDKSLIAAS